MKAITPLDIEYKVTTQNSRWEYRVVLDSQTMDNLHRPKEKPSWTELEYKKCRHCPLQASQHSHCPLALQMVDLIARCTELISYEEVHVEVTTPERTFKKDTTAQRAISSVMGLVMATSGCPYTRPFRPMARFHLPFATEEETMFRAVSAYLLSQYFEYKKGETPDMELDGLQTIYEEIHTMNIDFSKRMLGAVEKDSSMNALVVLDVFAQTMSFVIEDSLVELEHLFES